MGEKLRQRLRLDVGREICRQYPLFCFLLLCLSAASLLLNRDLTDDESFVDELRITLRFFASVLIRRIHKVDIPSIITKKLLKAAMKHIEVIVKARQKVKNTEYLQQAALEEYGPELHVALRSRRDELHYLRKLTELLFPYILPPKATDCRSLTLLIREILSGSVFLPSLDFLADPDTVNHLLIIFIDDSPPEKATEPASPLVPFLQKFAEPRNKKPSVLKLELKQIREQQDLLFRFMNFLKQEGAVHVLQFCLTVEEFNDRILRPELSNDEMLSLHEELQKIYKTYCLDESIDKIRFDPFIVEEIQRIAEGPYIDVVKLQTMRCLFEAYEHVLSLLENVFTPMFCHSDEIEEGIVVMEDDSPVEAVSTPNTPRNLAAWKISIPYVDFFEDPSSERKEKKERIPVFCIDVERNDRRAGTFPDAQLPSKRIIGPKNYEFLKSKREEFQEYLQKGQHLEPFIMNFINSCESPKPKPSRPELTILSPTSENNKKLFNDLFKNNANRAENTERKQNQNYFMEVMTIDGVYDYLMYVDAIFCENTEPRSLQDKQKGAKKTFEEMMNYIPDLIVKCIGEETRYESVRLLFDGLQQPVLNKQLTYVLLDIVIQELFPELNKVQKEVTSVTSWM
ncbi:Sorting nexin-14 [Tupaia chinensis]|uniref:Sorting nexin-14 n=1 Tax=Tupaia chinensis TaxID=246437 RepID=L9L4Z7_TUPCH|nr:Sorting nexin-14 [Tupaia chinensis]